MSKKISPLQTEKYQTMKLSEPWFTYVKNGSKKYEIRLYDEKRQDLKLGDLIEFTDTNGQNGFFKRIDHLSVHKTFELSLRYKGLKDSLPGVKTFRDGIAIYHAIPGYKEKEAKYRTLLISLASCFDKPKQYRKVSN